MASVEQGLECNTGPIKTKIGPDLFFCNNSTDSGCQELPVGSNGLCKLSHHSNPQSDNNPVPHGGVGLPALSRHLGMMRVAWPRKLKEKEKRRKCAVHTFSQNAVCKKCCYQNIASSAC